MSSSTKRIRRRPEQAEAEILDAASELLEFSAFRDLTVSAVMDRTGMQRPAFYKYVSDLDALVVRLLARIEGEMMEAAALWLTDYAGGPRKLGDALEAAIAVYAKHGHVLAAAHAASFQGEAVERYYRYGLLQAFVDAVTARIEADNAAGHADVPDPEGVARGLVLMNAAALAEALGRPGVDPPPAVAQTNVFMWERVIYGQSRR